jgi:hypothetical protein
MRWATYSIVDTIIRCVTILAGNNGTIECSLFDKYAIHTANPANITPARIIQAMNAAEDHAIDPLPLSCRAVISNVHEARYIKQPNKSNCFQVMRPWYLKSGQKMSRSKRMVPPTGILNQKTQRQVEWVVIMPPTTGPLFYVSQVLVIRDGA